MQERKIITTLPPARLRVPRLRSRHGKWRPNGARPNHFRTSLCNGENDPKEPAKYSNHQSFDNHESTVDRFIGRADGSHDADFSCRPSILRLIPDTNPPTRATELPSPADVDHHIDHDDKTSDISEPVEMAEILYLAFQLCLQELGVCSGTLHREAMLRFEIRLHVFAVRDGFDVSSLLAVKRLGWQIAGDGAIPTDLEAIVPCIDLNSTRLPLSNRAICDQVIADHQAFDP